MSAAVEASVLETLGPAAAGGLLARRVLGFVRLLRDNGFPVGLGETADALRAARIADLSGPRVLRWSLRALLWDRGSESVV